MLMKKVILFAVSAFAAFSMSAQIYVGGSLGFSSSKLDVGADLSPLSEIPLGQYLGIKNGDKGPSFSGSSFQIRPEIGYKINDKMALGIELGYTKGAPTFGNFSSADLKGTFTSVSSAIADLTSGKDFSVLTGLGYLYYTRDFSDLQGFSFKASSFAVAPYFRYNFVSNKYFDIFGEVRIGYAAGKLKTEIYESEKLPPTESVSAGDIIGVVKTDDVSVKLNIFEASFRPGIAVKITDRINLTAKLGYLGYQNLSLGLDDVAKKLDIEKVDMPKPKLSRFGLNLDANNIIFGLTYNFK